jgi:hypothetical protein
LQILNGGGNVSLWTGAYVPLQIPKVLLVTKRTPELCATKAMLNMAGYDVAAVTNIETACAVGRGIRYRAAIVCLHSFTAAERDTLAADLTRSNPDIKVMARCPGCLGCDEGRANVMGTLPQDDDTIAGVIVALGACQPDPC